MSRHRFNQVLTFYNIQVYEEDGYGRVVEKDDGSEFKVLARQTTVSEDYITKSDYPISTATLAFIINYNTSKKIKMNQRLDYRGDVYKVDKIKTNDTHKGIATITVSASKRRV